MANEIKNPYLQRILELAVIDNKTPEQIRELEELDIKSRDYTEKALADLKGHTLQVEDKIEEIRKSPYKISKQYKEMIEGSREAYRIVKLYMIAKKEIRDEMAARRKHRVKKESNE